MAHRTLDKTYQILYSNPEKSRSWQGWYVDKRRKLTSSLLFYLQKLMFTLREENIAWRHVDSVIFLHPCVGFLGSEALVSTLMSAFYGFHWSLKQSMCLHKFIQRGRKRYQFNLVIKYLIVTDKNTLSDSNCVSIMPVHIAYLKLTYS